MLILPGFSPIIGSTEAEAQRFSDELNALSDPEVGRNRLSLRFGGQRFLASAVGQAARARRFPGSENNEASRSRTEVIVGFVGSTGRHFANCWQSSPARAAISSSKERPSRWPISWRTGSAVVWPTDST